MAAATTGHPVISNNVAWLCDRFYNQLTEVEPALIVDNAAGAITTARLVNVSDWDEQRAVVLTEIPFVDAASGDFRLNTLAGGGSLCRRAGAFGGDLGAIQSPLLALQELGVMT